MRLDLHTHTEHSSDSEMTIRSMVTKAKKVGLAGFAVTDHNSIEAHRQLKDFKRSKLLLVPGVEVSTSEGHVLGYGVREPIEKGLTVVETFERIVEAGGLPVAAHPYRRVTGIGEKAVLEGKFEILEVFNARTRMAANEKAKALAETLHASITGGSDGHHTDELGRGFTDVPDNIETVDELIEAIRDGETGAGGVPPTIKKYIGDNTVNLIRWVRRGMKKM